MKTSQDNFHPALGHVSDGCQVVMASGDTLEIHACMAGWRVTLVGSGQVLGTFPHAAGVLDYVVHYDRSA